MIGTSEKGDPTDPGDTLADVRSALPEVAQEQRADAYYSEVIRYLEQGTLPEDEGLARRIVLSRSRYDIIDGIFCFVDRIV